MMRTPDLTSPDNAIRVWRLHRPPEGVGPKDWQAGILTAFIDADPGRLSPFVRDWFMGVVSLAPIEGVPPAHLHFPGARYELNLWSIDPGFDSERMLRFYDQRVSGDLSDPLTGFLLKPVEIVFQWAEGDDASALAVGEAFLRGVVGGEQIDRPTEPIAAALYDAYWRTTLRNTVEHFTTGH